MTPDTHAAPEESSAPKDTTTPTDKPASDKPARVDPASLVRIGNRGIILRSFDELLRFGAMAVKAGVAPKGMSEGAAALAIQAGLEVGLPPLGGLRHAVVIDGNISWRGQAALALIQNSPVCVPGTLKVWHEGEGDELTGIAVAQRRGYAEPFRREFTVEDAKKAGLWGKRTKNGHPTPWITTPETQLEWRAVGLLARFHFSDVVGGFPLDVEARDFENLDDDEHPRHADSSAQAAPDPLLDVIDGEPSPAPPDADGIVDAEIVEPDSDGEASMEVEEPEPSGEPVEENGDDDQADDDPPFASHEEADRAIAEAENGELFP